MANKDGTIDVMFYDSSPWAGEVQTLSFITGGKFYRLFHGLEYEAGFESWKEAFDWLNTIDSDKKISTLQFWGHGSSASIALNGERLTIKDFINPRSPHYANMLKLKSRLTPESVIWLRTCSTFAFAGGQEFAKALADFFGCIVAGHTHKIWAWQSGLHTLRPGEEPNWSTDEAFALKDKGDTTAVTTAWSAPWAPNSIFFLTGKIPSNW